MVEVEFLKILLRLRLTQYFLKFEKQQKFLFLMHTCFFFLEHKKFRH